MECSTCKLQKTSKCIVTGTGDIDADILFITDPPGQVEVLINDPLSGPSLVMLKSLLKFVDIKIKYYVVPVVMCQPEKMELISEYILKCQYNVEQIIKLTSPKLIVCLGDLAYQFYKFAGQDVLKLIHPNYIIKTGGFSSPHYLPSRNKLTNKIKEVFSESYRINLG